jgi:hypothetical protein
MNRAIVLYTIRAGATTRQEYRTHQIAAYLSWIGCTAGQK